MGVPGELEADAGLLHQRQTVGHVVEENAGLAAIEAEAVQSGAQANRVGGVAKGDAQNLEAIDDDHLIGEDADSGAGECRGVLRSGAKLVVVAGGEIDAEGWGKLLEGSGKAVRVGPGSVEEIAGKKDDVWMEVCGEARDAAAESKSVDVAQMQVADHEGCAATPGRRQVGEMDWDAADANPAGIEHAIDAGHERQGEERGGDERAEKGQVWGEWGKPESQVGKPTEAGGQEEEVEEPQPHGGNPVDRNHQPVGEVEAEQGGDNEAEGQQKERGPKRQSWSGAEIDPEDDQSAIDEPMDKKQKRLHQQDANDWPGLQTGVSLVQ